MFFVRISAFEFSSNFIRAMGFDQRKTNTEKEKLCVRCSCSCNECNLFLCWIFLFCVLGNLNGDSSLLFVRVVHKGHLSQWQKKKNVKENRQRKNKCKLNFTTKAQKIKKKNQWRHLQNKWQWEYGI